MATDAQWKKRIGLRLAELRKLKGWSLADLERETKGRLAKSRISNYEQGLRLVSVAEAEIFGEALEEAAAHILCLDDDMPALSKLEAKLINDLRALPENQRAEYMDRIGMLAEAYKKTPVTNDRVLRTAYNPDKRPKGSKVDAKRPIRRHDQ